MAGNGSGRGGTSRASGGSSMAGGGQARKPLRGVGAALKGNLKGFKGLPVVVRNRAEAASAQRVRSNALGRATAAKRGFNEAVGQRRAFADSAPRPVIARPRVSQLTISGRVERVGAGRFRTIGERTAGGRVYRSNAASKPVPGSRSYKRNLDRLVKANGGRDVAAFRF